MAKRARKINAIPTRKTSTKHGFYHRDAGGTHAPRPGGTPADAEAHYKAHAISSTIERLQLELSNTISALPICEVITVGTNKHEDELTAVFRVLAPDMPNEESEYLWTEVARRFLIMAAKYHSNATRPWDVSIFKKYFLRRVNGVGADGESYGMVFAWVLMVRNDAAGGLDIGVQIVRETLLAAAAEVFDQREFKAPWYGSDAISAKKVSERTATTSIPANINGTAPKHAMIMPPAGRMAAPYDVGISAKTAAEVLHRKRGGL